MTRPIGTPEQKAKAARWRAAGLTYTAIANRLKMTPAQAWRLIHRKRD